MLLPPFLAISIRPSIPIHFGIKKTILGHYLLASISILQAGINKEQIAYFAFVKLTHDFLI